jgi:hypothetical protein
MRLYPEQIDTTGAADGNALVYVATVDEYRPGPAPGVQSIIAGPNVVVDSTDPLHPKVSARSLLTSKTSAGDAGLVWGGADDDELIYTEGP